MNENTATLLGFIAFFILVGFLVSTCSTQMTKENCWANTKDPTCWSVKP